MAHSAPPPALFNPATEEWEAYIDRFQMFLESSNLKDANGNRKRAVFLTHCGPAVFKMAKALAKPNDVKEMDWDTLAPLLKNHYAPAIPMLIRRYDFYRRSQRDGETIADFVADLRDLGGLCEFADMEEAIRDRFVLGLRDSTIKSKIIAKGNISLANAMADATADEATRKSAVRLRRTSGHERNPPSTIATTEERHTTAHQGNLESSSESDYEEEDVHRLQSDRDRRDRAGRKAGFRCAGCGGDHPRSDCRFLDAVCHNCEKRGHIAKVCRHRRNQSPKHRGATLKRRDGTPPRQRERQMENRWNRDNRNKRPGEPNRREDTHQMIVIGHSSNLDARKVRITVKIENQPCDMEVDSGSYLSMVSWNTIRKIVPGLHRRDLSDQKLIIKDYQGNRIPVAGVGQFQVTFKSRRVTLPLTIVDRDRPSLLGLQWFAPLGIEVTGVNHTDQTKWEAEILRDYKEVFDASLGKYKGTPISFNLSPEVAPIRLKPRRVPFALKPKIDQELDKLIAQGVLEPIDHARWETPIVTPIKPDGSLRICGDYKATLNHALQQSAYPVPVVQHLLHSLGGGRIFAKLDLAQAYQQLPVDTETAEAQTIVTHRGAFKCNRLQFGVSVAPGVFQSLMERLLHGIQGVVPYFDDVLIAAANEAQLEHRLRAVLQVFKDSGLKVKKDKCKLRTERVEFLGYLVDKDGIHPTNQKLKAIREAPRPKSKTELQAFLGLINFYNVFLPRKATVAEPLHRLLDKAATWTWGRRQEDSFQTIKNLLTSDAVLMQYSDTLPLAITCDASPFGVGAILSHTLPDGREAPIAFFSRTLSKPERNYSQLDKEALAIISGIKRFHEYVYGRQFSIITDHKPLLGILAGDRPTPHILSPRMTRWSEFMAAYNYRLIHRPGKQILHADALSRCPLPEGQTDPAPTLQVLQIETLPNHPLTASDIAHETRRDRRLARVLTWVERGWPEDFIREEFKPFKNRRTELFTQRGCILWGDRVIIPETLQSKVLGLLHEGHPGIVRMKALARSYVWWPGMDKQIEAWVSACDSCQQARSSPPATPPSTWEMPRGPWSRIHIDFAGPTNGHTFLIVVDAYSNWLEVKKMRSITTEAVIERLEKLFATHGIPDVLVSDNGPQLTAIAFEKYLADQGIRHALTAPAHPAANGRAEIMVQYTKKTIQKIEHGNIQAKINKMLLLQHITPGAITNKCPAELLMGRKLRSHLDRLNPTYVAEKPPGSTSRHRSFAIGATVFAKSFTGDPLWVPAQVTQVTGPKSYRLLTTDGRIWKRHIDQLRSRLVTNPTPVENNKPGGEGENGNLENITPSTPAITEREELSPPDSPGDPELQPARGSPGRDWRESSSTPSHRDGDEDTSISPDKTTEGHHDTPGSPDLSVRSWRATRRPLDPRGNQETLATRKSSRQTKRPAYLRDYETPTLKRNQEGRGVKY